MEPGNAPFTMGQEIVALTTTASWKKGDIKVVDGLSFCCQWLVDVGLKVPYPTHCKCTNCGDRKKVNVGDIWWAYAKDFAPVQHQYTDISKELADGLPYYKEEVPDKVMVPEKAPATIENQFLEGNEEMIKVFNQLSPEDQKLYAPRVAEMIELGKKLLK